MDASEKDRGPEEQQEPEIIDRRSASRAKTQEPPPSEAAPEAAEEAPPPADDQAPAGEVDPRLLEAMFPESVYDILSSVVLMLAEIAWRKIGLRASPRTGKIEKDLAEAQVAIDTLAFLADKLGAKLAPGQQRDLRNLATDLKVNFARQSRPEAEGN